MIELDAIQARCRFYDGCRADTASIHYVEDVTALLAEIARITKERDAAVEDLKRGKCCTTCADEECNKSATGIVYDCVEWKWRGTEEKA